MKGVLRGRCLDGEDLMWGFFLLVPHVDFHVADHVWKSHFYFHVRLLSVV